MVTYAVGACEVVIKLKRSMKTILNIVIGIFLVLLLAGGIWLVARAPQGENIDLAFTAYGGTHPSKCGGCSEASWSL